MAFRISEKLPTLLPVGAKISRCRRQHFTREAHFTCPQCGQISLQKELLLQKGAPFALS
jgi:hypothetical protein